MYMCYIVMQTYSFCHLSSSRFFLPINYYDDDIDIRYTILVCTIIAKLSKVMISYVNDNIID